MAYTTASAEAMLKLFLQALPFPGLADPTAGGLTQLWLGLYKGDPGAVADQTTNEVVYPAYGRIATARSASGWTVTGNEGQLVNAAQFLAVTGSVDDSATHIGLGTLQTGPGLLLVHGPLSLAIPIRAGTVPRLSPATKVRFSVVSN
ncbi:hypothetical protein H4CHR_02988 [Variovorax sp. PBS-H4]|uniref:phage tail fiber protein n=1 Tax=Variovorax sp. PBS-H4 TaxID=434008 RepID=UPI00131783AD|nr:hypothetical protein [Variovorax sp. PBS-H4]VTU32322.1 hypothetical protein H4CHR_02988 [Variovorax sp. PBS-H4]